MSGDETSAPKRIILDKIACSTWLAELTPRVDLGSEIVARAGAVVAGRIRNAKSTYNTLEDVHGRMRRLMPGDLVAGCLGPRNALHGYVGVVPPVVKVGDVLNVLNLGGVIGKVTSYNPDVGPPFEFEVLGSILHYPTFGERQSTPWVVDPAPELFDESPLPERMPPVVVIAGTSMNAGKTTAICEVIRHCKRAGKKVAAAKCTGVSLLRDTLEMRDFGASATLSFMDFGVVTTTAEHARGVTRAILREFAKEAPDMVLLELGDGILGSYGVAEILSDPEIRNAISATFLCAYDPVSAWGGVHLLRERFGIQPAAITGPVTDNMGGPAVACKDFGVKAFNARREGEKLAALVLELMQVPSA